MEQQKRPLFTFEDEEPREHAEEAPPQGGQKEPRPVVLVDVDIPLSRLAVFFLKLLAVVAPGMVLLAVVFHFAWTLVRMG